MSKRVPDRWRDYESCTWNPIKNERIIAFKTPLSSPKFDHEQRDDDGLIESERFTPTDLVRFLAEKDLHLGLVLDFTFTKRYYSPQELTDQGVRYTKMMCPGHELPKEKDVKRFEHEVHSFLNEDKTGKLVGVHCTHGVNRTGYMVCRYLIDCKGYKPEEAIEAFDEARGHPIERENYLEDLKSRTPGHGSHLNKRRHNSEEREFPPKRSRDCDTANWRERGPATSEREFSRHGRENYYEPNYRHPEDRYNPRSHHHNPWHQPRRDYDGIHHHQHTYQGRPQHSSNYNDHYHDTRGYNDYYNSSFRGQGNRTFTEHHIDNRHPPHGDEDRPERRWNRPSHKDFRR